MFAVLGDIQFEVVGSPEAYESAGAYDFAEQKVVESKPQLQWVGDDLERLKFELIWHASFTNPAAAAGALAGDGGGASRTAAGVRQRGLPRVLCDRIDQGEIAATVGGRRADRDSGRTRAQGVERRPATAFERNAGDGILAAGNHDGVEATGREAERITPGVSALLSTPSATGASGPES